MDNIHNVVENKNGCYSVGSLYGRPIERLAFHYDRHEEITRYSYSDEAYSYVLSSNSNACVLLTFKILG